MNGLPVVWVVVNMERGSQWQAQTDSYLGSFGVEVCGNDYTATTLRTVRDLFAPPSASNPDPRPVFVAINCLADSTSHSYREVLINEPYAGGGALNFSARIAAWRNVIDSVEAAPPRISDWRLMGGALEFKIPGQRGRTNRVEWTSDFSDWLTLTNVFGFNGPALIGDPGVVANPARYFRVVRW